MNPSQKPSTVRSFSAPGKTFLLGEYLILEGGSAILAATGPRFVLTVDAGAAPFSPFHPESPAGKLLISSFKKLNGRIEFSDPHQGLGGLGASSAQFALCYAAIHGLKSIEYRSEHWLALQREFRNLTKTSDERQPSGADLISQLAGGLILYNGTSNSVEKLNWGFPELTFTLVRTGQKVQTHRHLATEFEVPRDEMQAEVAKACEALESKNEEKFIDAVNSYAEVLFESGLTASATVKLLARMRKESELFLGLKGCGALGADVILAVHSKGNRPAVEKWLRTEGLAICGSLESLSKGLHQDVSREAGLVLEMSSSESVQ
jgi:mevalonate kinase